LCSLSPARSGYGSCSHPNGLGRDREESYRDRLAFGREPSHSERNAAIFLIGSHGSVAFCRALYNANEFVYVP
jgi:hypothetical protein